MSKSDLTGGSLWTNYSDKVADRMNNPQYMGTITEEEAQAAGSKLIVADHGAESCGDAVRLYWSVEPDTGRILNARFKSFGCGTAIASSDMMAELCIGKTVDEALKITNIDVEQALRDEPDTPAVPPQKMHCSVMAYGVIKAAAAAWKGVPIAVIEDAEIVCECARVTLSSIREIIRLNNLQSIDEITNYTKAGAFCKSCIKPGGHEKRKWYLTDILAETRDEMEKESAAWEDLPFMEMSSFKQFKVIERVLDAEIRPSLHQDGGDIDVEDFAVENGIPRVTIAYRGACLGCTSSSMGTLGFIESILKSKLHPDFHVEVESPSIVH